MWTPGIKLVSETSPELGVGVVIGLDGRFIDVYFPDADKHLKFSPDAAGIRPVQLAVGDAVRLPDGTVTTIESIAGDVATLATGTRESLNELWPHVPERTPVDRLREGSVDPLLDVLNRLDGQRLLNYRRRGEVASLVGGRVELFGHQIDTAARAIADDPVRWLLADEVGLGKTVVACMVTSALIRMGRVEKAVIIVPETLSVQWLGELYRKFHQVFVHIDRERLADVRTDFGHDVNPFDVHRLAIVSAELLAEEPGLLFLLQKAPPQLIVVDEAHQAFEEELGRLLLPIAAATPHALLLTATPFQMGESGFMGLVEALGLPIEEDAGVHVVHNASAVTRTEIEAMPARLPKPVDIEAPGALDQTDPRVAWLEQRLPDWQERQEKALVFVNTATGAKRLADTLTRVTGKRVFVFHEEMGTKQRDIELAQFRLSNTTFLVSSGAGGEGRNFQFCEHVVHLELPDDPVVLEQRIGRLDRIGRTRDVPIYYFRAAGASGDLARIYERVGIFADAAIGSSPAMAHLRKALRSMEVVDVETLAADTMDHIEKAAGSWRFPDSHVRADAARVLAQIPEDLDEMLQRFCLDAAERVGLDVVEKEGEAVHYFEYGTGVEVDSIPGLPVGTRFLGTFDREEAIENEALDFFANGHPLVEGLLAELEDSPRGRVGAVRLPRRHTRQLHGLYLLLLEGRESVGRPRLVPLMHGGPPLDEVGLRRQADTLYEALDLGVELEPERVAALMERVANQPVLQQLDGSQVVQAILVAVMD